MRHGSALFALISAVGTAMTQHFGPLKFSILSAPFLLLLARLDVIDALASIIFAGGYHFGPYTFNVCPALSSHAE